MTYMVAKSFHKAGSVALKRHVENLESDVRFLKELSDQWLHAYIQILTVGNFDVHAEYEPVTYVTSREDFEAHIEELARYSTHDRR